MPGSGKSIHTLRTLFVDDCHVCPASLADGSTFTSSALCFGTNELGMSGLLQTLHHTPRQPVSMPEGFSLEVEATLQDDGSVATVITIATVAKNVTEHKLLAEAITELLSENLPYEAMPPDSGTKQ